MRKISFTSCAASFTCFLGKRKLSNPAEVCSRCLSETMRVRGRRPGVKAPKGRLVALAMACVEIKRVCKLADAAKLVLLDIALHKRIVLVLTKHAVCVRGPAATFSAKS